MITKIHFTGYKLFKTEQTLDLKPLTVLIGKNSSGKSSITKLLPLLEHSLEGRTKSPIEYENEGISVGAEFRDLLYGRHKIGTLEFGIEDDQGQSLKVRLASGVKHEDLPGIIYWRHQGDEFIYSDKSKKYFNTKTGEKKGYEFSGFRTMFDEAGNLFGSYSLNDLLPTNYIGPYRHIPAPTLRYKTPHNMKMGKEGENAYPFLVSDILHQEGWVAEKVSNWYRNNFEGWGVELDTLGLPDYKVMLTRTSPRLKINFRDTGQGMIQVLPLVVSSFNATNHLNIFEQPELHLHPGAHGNLAELFVDSALELGNRFLIETHSQNFVLRLRRLIAERKLKAHQIAIYYVDFDEEASISILRKIEVDGEGEVDYWPENVFNESLDEALAIRIAQKKNK